MPRKCSVAGCNTGYDSERKTREDNKKISTYKFPAAYNECKEWVEAIPNIEKSVDNITKDMCVCALHWPEGVPMKKRNKYLVPAVPPSVFPNVNKSQIPQTPKTPLSGKALSSLQVQNPHIDQLELYRRRQSFSCAENFMHRFISKLENSGMVLARGNEVILFSEKRNGPVFDYTVFFLLQFKTENVCTKAMFEAYNGVKTVSVPFLKNGSVSRWCQLGKLLLFINNCTVTDSGDGRQQLLERQITLMNAPRNARMKSDNNVRPKSQGQAEHVGGLDQSCESEGSSYINDSDIIVHFKSQGQVESFGGTEHLKPELSDESFDDVTDEKPCIAALRASVAAYSVNEGRAETELEPFPNTETSSQEILEPHCETASNEATDQEFLMNRPSEENARDSGKLECSQRVEEKERKTSQVSPSEEEINFPGRSSGGQLPCIRVDCQRRMTHSQKPCKCTICGERFSCNSHLSVHKRIHTGEKPHQCDVCGKAFRLHSGLYLHKKIHSSERPYKCDVCGKKFKRKNSLSQHKLVHTGEKPYLCDVCGKAFRRPSLLAGHKKTHSESDEKPCKCDVCGKKFRRRKYLPQHMRVHTGEKSYQCDVCRKAFGNRSILAAHKNIHTGEKPYKCEICCKVFWHSSSLYKHKRIHTGERPFRCALCGRAFRCSSALYTHKRVHTNEKPYKCDVCGKEFKWSNVLYVHKKIHTGSGTNKGVYKEKKHTGEKPHVCDVCGKGFGSSCNLSIHKSRHTSERPFKCDVCGKGFKCTGDLSKHMIIHSSETPYKCDDCGKGFKRSSALSRHKRIHTGERPYKCDVCGKGFVSHGNLSRHRQIHK